MKCTGESDLPLISEENAPGQVAQIYAEVKRDLHFPVVPNVMKALAVSPAVLATHWNFRQSLHQHTTLPESLTSMILYAIAEAANCTYCSAAHELTCRTLGIDEETLRAMGVTNAEIVEIIHLAAVGNYFDTLADALKIQVGSPVTEALGR